MSSGKTRCGRCAASFIWRHTFIRCVTTPQAANVYREVNVAGSQFVAEQAARAGVRRFVYLSSIKVNGEGGGPAPYRAEDAAESAR